MLDKFGIEAIYLFGSRALGKEHPLSDYDYAILCKEPGHSKGDPFYFQLYDLLSDFSPRTLKNDVIDIVFLKDANLELQFHVIQHGRVIFDKEPNARCNFEARIVLLYCDFQPILKEQDRIILQSL